MKTSEEWKSLGNEAFSKKEFNDAVQHYTEAIKVDPKNHILFSNRSASYGGLKKWQESIADAKECIRLDPTFIKGYYRLATAQIESKDYDGAMATIKQGLNVDANNAQLLKQMRTVKQLQKAVASRQESSTKAALAPSSALNSKALDSATSRELQDLHVQYTQTSRELNTVQANLFKVQREYKVTEVTKAELIEVPDSAKCYRSVGKMFLLSTKERVVEHLEKQMDDQKKKESDYTQKMEYLERRMKSQRQNIEELIASNVAAE